MILVLNPTQQQAKEENTAYSSLSELSCLVLQWLRVPGFCPSEPFCTSGTCTCTQRALQWSGSRVGVWCPVLLWLQWELWPYNWALRGWMRGDLLSWQQCKFCMRVSFAWFVTDSMLKKQVEQDGYIVMILSCPELCVSFIIKFCIFDMRGKFW